MKYYFVQYKKAFAIRLLISILGVLFVFFFSYSTSPLYPDYYGGDSAQFLTIGKEWMLGRIPYKELFDHKGPFIFFVDMLGFMITGNKSGIVIIQSIFSIITVNALFDLAKLHFNSNRYAITVVVISMVIYKRNYNEGNSVEEYCLPFLAVSIYFQMKFLYHKLQQHSPYAAVFYGITFGICAMTRVTNSVLIGAGVLVISIILLLQKQYLNLFWNALGFLLGFAAVFAPFALYFTWKNCFQEFIYGTFIYNFEYAHKMPSWIKNVCFNNMVTFFKFYFPYWCLVFAAVLAFCRKARHIALFYTLAFALETYLFLSGQLFPQYPAICMPQAVLLLNELVPLDMKKSVKGITTIIAFPVIMIICAYSIRNMTDSFNIYHVYHDLKDSRGSYESLLFQIPDDEFDSFAAYGDNRFKELYLAYGLTPSYKYFVIQEWHASFSNFVKKDIHSVFKNGNAKWILTAGETNTISDILRERYDIYDSIDDYVLYKMR